MPNTLAHLGVQALATRAAIRAADLRWVFVGVVVPDVPWIVGRATRTLIPSIHGHSLWAYLIAQSSLLISLLLCGAIAALASRSFRVFAILSTNSLLHLLLDGIQEKWDSGVHILAPLSWSGWRENWFAIESWPTYLLTALGLAVGLAALIQADRSKLHLTLNGRRIAVAAALLAAYITVPISLRHGPINADANSVGTLRDRGHRSGRQITLGRVSYLVAQDGHYIRTYVGEELQISSKPLRRPGIVSIRAAFIDDTTLVIHELWEHKWWPRDLMNYVGLTLVLLVWLVGVLRRAAHVRSS